MGVSEARQKHERALMRKKNVVGVGVGRRGNEPAVTVFVEKKVPKSELSSQDLVPRAVDGVRTDVVETGKIVAQGVYTDRRDPTPPGYSIGHVDITAGTFGCVVFRDGQTYILSNNHVLACSNEAEVGDAIVQPGPYDGAGTIIAELSDWVELQFSQSGTTCVMVKWLTKAANKLAEVLGSRHRLAGYRQASELNYADAAIAVPCKDDNIVPGIVELGTPEGVGEPTLGMDVQKVGRTTGLTQSTVEHVESTVRVSYGGGKTATFYGQAVTGAMSEGGDSGSAVLDMDMNVVGLLFGGSKQVTIFSPIRYVRKLLGIEVVTA